MKIKHKCSIFALVLVAAICSLAVGCAPRALEESPSSGEGEAIAASSMVPWTIDMDCSSCHESEEASATDSMAPYSVHVAELSTCTECHLDSDGSLTEAHADYLEKELPVKLRKTDVASEICLSCHVQDELIVLTQAYTGLTDAYDLTVNPHDMPQTEQHLASINCSSCHKMHLEDDLARTSRQLCITCHHQGVYQCGTCHA